MRDTPSKRQRRILDMLAGSPEVAVRELVETLGVSAMTVHRDLDALAAAGLTVKSRGRAALVAAALPESPAAQACALCAAPLRSRTAFVIHNGAAAPVQTCCAHCGFAWIERNKWDGLAFSADFIHGRMVDVQRAGYLVGSRVTLCCEPGILCFLGLDEAHAFRLGFGGLVFDFVGLQELLGRTHGARLAGAPKA